MVELIAALVMGEQQHIAYGKTISPPEKEYVAWEQERIFCRRFRQANAAVRVE